MSILIPGFLKPVPALGGRDGALQAAARERNRRPRLKMLFLAFLAAGAWQCSPSRHPNLIVISIDALRPDHLSTYGYSRDTSPTLSEIAKDGLVFQWAFAQAPWTIPSHASLLTGRYPCAHRADARHPIQADIPMLAERLKKVGYRTAGFVNTAYLGSKYGFARGFDTYTQSFESTHGDIARELPQVLAWIRKEAVLPRDGHSVPFFLFVHTMSVHGPYKAPGTLLRRYRPAAGKLTDPDPDLAYLRGLPRHDYLHLEQYKSLAELVAHYDAGIRNVDEHLARLFALLRELDLYHDSVIVITSDHGESLFDHRIWVGHGRFLYDDEIRIPFIVKPARRRPARGTVDTLVESVDIVPTVMELLGFPVPDEVDGQSLAGLIRKGHERGLEEVAMGASSNMGGMQYVRTPLWKYIGPWGYSLERVVKDFNPQPATEPELLKRLPVGEQLFDLKNDPGEQLNVIDERPRVADQMRERLKVLRERCRHLTRERQRSLRPEQQEREQLKALGYVN
jgi:choline-sulfatase